MRDDMTLAEALGALNRVTDERDRARNLASYLLDENGALTAAGHKTRLDLEELVAQVISWVDGKDWWYDPTARYYDSARDFLDELERMDNR